MNISLITSSHTHYDERIYHHLAYALRKNGHHVEIVSSLSNLKTKKEISINSFDGNSISKNKKIKKFIECLTSFNPHIIICSEPLTIHAAKRYSKNNKSKIIYDITEWYPSKKNLHNHPILTKWFHFLKYLFFNLYAFSKADAFIFGEFYKSRIPKILHPKKPFEFISYYPDYRFINKKTPILVNNTLRLSYSGKISIEKGFINFLNVVKELTLQNPRLVIYIKIIGWFDKKDKEICKDLINQLDNNINTTINYYEIQNLKNYIELINDTDIFLDLRSNDLENTHCLPIKLFYYMALERPVIYSDLKSIRKEIEIDQFGHLVNPTSTSVIASIILNYFNNNELYYKHSSNASRLFNTRYNWQKIEPLFLNFIDKLAKE